MERKLEKTFIAADPTGKKHKLVGGGQKLSHYRGQFEPPAWLPSEMVERGLRARD